MEAKWQELFEENEGFGRQLEEFRKALDKEKFGRKWGSFIEQEIAQEKELGVLPITPRWDPVACIFHPKNVTQEEVSSSFLVFLKGGFLVTTPEGKEERFPISQIFFTDETHQEPSFLLKLMEQGYSLEKVVEKMMQGKKELQSQLSLPSQRQHQENLQPMLTAYGSTTVSAGASSTTSSVRAVCWETSSTTSSAQAAFLDA